MNIDIRGVLQGAQFVACQSPSTILDVLARMRTIIQSLAGAAATSGTGTLNVPVTLMSFLRQDTQAILNLLILRPIAETMQFMAATQSIGAGSVICTDALRISRDMSMLLQSLNAQQPTMVGSLFVTVPAQVIQNWLALVEDALTGLRVIPPPTGPAVPPVATSSGLLAPGI
ncbi:MAG: hypothetical protein ACM3XM_00105 [Mycobacterium leprae]